MALRKELAQVKILNQENGTAILMRNGNDLTEENKEVNQAQDIEINKENDSKEDNNVQGEETENHLNSSNNEMQIQMN